jgi:hypothetical protein
LATFSFTTTPPQEKAEIISQQFRTIFNDIYTYLNTFNPDGLVFPAKAGNGGRVVRLNAGATAWEYARAAMVDGSSFVAGDILVHTGTEFTKLAKGTEGQLVGITSGNLAYRTVASGLIDWSVRTSNFSATDKGQYSINTGLNVQLPSPTATINFRVKPAIGQDFTATPSTLVRAGSEQIAGDAASFTMDVNAIYEITSNGTNWDVAIMPIGRV